MNSDGLFMLFPVYSNGNFNVRFKQEIIQPANKKESIPAGENEIKLEPDHWAEGLYIYHA